MNETLSNIDFTRALPPTLKSDGNMLSLAKVIANELQETIKLSRLNIIYARIDELEENVLDILAYDFHVDWYIDTETVEVKRKIIKDSVKIHKRLGTKYAVERAMSAVFPGSTIQEWFEYNGKRYCFRIKIQALFDNVSIEKVREVLDKVYFFKNLRSHLDGVEVLVKAEFTSTDYHAALSFATVKQFNVEQVETNTTGTDYSVSASTYYEWSFSVETRPITDRVTDYNATVQTHYTRAYRVETRPIKDTAIDWNTTALTQYTRAFSAETQPIMDMATNHDGTAQTYLSRVYVMDVLPLNDTASNYSGGGVNETIREELKE